MIPPYVFKHLEADETIKSDPKLLAEVRLAREVSKVERKKRSLSKDISPGIAERFVYDLENQNTDMLPGKEVRKEDEPEVEDPIVNIVYENHGKVREYIKNCLKRDSFDNHGGDLHGSVHVLVKYNNAFWNGEQMAYGDGDGEVFNNLALSLDVAAHEIGHGVVQHTAGLRYFSMPGALNESFADVFGVTCEQYTKGEDIVNGNWLVGDEIVGSKFPGKALRSFLNEKAYSQDPQPKHMKNFYWMFDDNQGVHINSGIINHAFYLFCLNYVELGGKHSYEVPLEIWYKSLAHLNSFSNFWDLKKATIKVCKLAHPQLVPALEDAFAQVGL